MFLGRKDHQIKIRGYRVELGEIENILTSYPNIEEAVTIVANLEETEQKILVSVIMPSQKIAIDIDDLKSFCKQKMPIYAIPDKIEILKDFPRTASGKINRKEIEKLIIE